jgi:hypothetical protein
MYYYGAYLFFLMVGSFIKLMTFGYSNYYMDSMTWGKTREIEAHDVVVHDDEATVVACETVALDDRPWEQVIEELQTVVTPSGSIAHSDSIEPCESSTSVEVCSPKDVLEEYMNVYCDETIFDPLKGNTQSKVEFFEINI